MAASPFAQRQQRHKEAGDKPAVSLDEALKVLRDHVRSPKAQSALRTLEGELESGPENTASKGGDDNESSGGGQDRRAEALARLGGGDSAKGDEGNSPFDKRRRRAKGRATAQKGM